MELRKRNCSLDAYRVFLMLGICILHASGIACRHPTQWFANMLYWCVPGFVLISGWFGLRFSIWKLFKLYGLALYAVLVAVSFKWFWGESFSWKDALRMLRTFWFLNAYAVLMCFSSVFNEASKISTGWGVLFLVFGWAFATTVPYVSSLVPSPMELTPYSGIMMGGVYLVGRMIRQYNIFDWMCLHKKVVIVAFVVSLVFAALGLCEYVSPFSLVIAIVVFWGFISSKWADGIGFYLAWLVPSCFSVYLISSRNAFGLPLMNSLLENLLAKGVPLGVAYFLVGFFVFFTCVIIDFPRRVAVYCIKKLYCSVKA